ncbi:MAG: right-handed parallel beta-helix repeat-containing protein [Candidatus Thorarchaeota archaeon]|nr:right-handed parallel beta-helix repeat-containing protein [Candidatus Thorarchaeota archaeon]
MVRRGVALLLVVILGLSIVNQCNIDREFKDTEMVIPVKRHEVSYISHVPFNITSDVDFESQAWPGNGSISNPYLIENLNITTNNSTCIWIMNTTSHFILQNCLFTSPVWNYTNFQSVYSITLTNVSNGMILGNQIVNSTTGISGYALSNCSISDNRFNVTERVIDVRFSNFTIILNNKQQFDPCHFGVSVTGCWNCTVSQNEFGNIISSGISAYGNYYSNFTENTLIATDLDLYPWIGIEVWGGESCKVSHNEIVNFFWSGIDVAGRHHLIEDNNVTSGNFGIHISATDCIVRRNNISDNSNSIVLVKANRTIVYENTITGRNGRYDTGIANYGGFDCEIHSNAITLVGLGIYLQGATEFNVSYNIVTDGRYGFVFGWYSNWGGVLDGPSFDCDISNNSFDGGGLFPQIENYGSWDFDTIRFEDNTVNNRPIGFFAYLDGTGLDGDDYGQIFLLSCTDVILTEGDFYGISSDIGDLYYDPGIASAITLLDCTGCEFGDIRFYNNTIGVNIQNSIDCLMLSLTGYDNSWAAMKILNSETIVIHGCYFRHNLKAIESDLSWDIRIFNCLIWENDEGIDLARSPNCWIDYNEVFENTDAILLDNSDECEVSDNSIYENSRGLLLNSSSDCLITSNTIANHSGVGISLDGTSHRNDIYQNTFVNNLPNAICEGSSNHWDDQVDTGNRWSDYSGEGPYIIDANDQDNFPIVDLPTATPPTGIDPGPKFPQYLIAEVVLIGAVVLVIIIVVVDRRRVIIVD